MNKFKSLHDGQIVENDNVFTNIISERQLFLDGLRKSRDESLELIHSELIRIKKSSKNNHVKMVRSIHGDKIAISDVDLSDISEPFSKKSIEHIEELKLAYFEKIKNSSLYQNLPIPLFEKNKDIFESLYFFGEEDIKFISNTSRFCMKDSFAIKSKDSGDITFLLSRGNGIYKSRFKIDPTTGKIIKRDKKYENIEQMLIHMITGCYLFNENNRDENICIPVFPIPNIRSWIRDLKLNLTTCTLDKGITAGGGNFSQVMTGKFKGHKIALKSTKNQQSEFAAELIIHSILDHPNIIPLIGIWENDKKFYLVFPFIDGGSLLDHIKTKSFLKLDDALNIYIRQMLNPLVYLEEKYIVHHDISLRNYLCHMNAEKLLHIQLTDFGTSWFLPFKHDEIDWRITAPEIYFCYSFDTKCDVFSFCLAILSLCSGGLNPVYFITGIKELKQFYSRNYSKNSSSSFILEKYKNLGIILSDFLSKGLSLDPSERLLSSELYESIPEDLENPEYVIDIYSDFYVDRDEYVYCE